MGCGLCAPVKDDAATAGSSASSLRRLFCAERVADTSDGATSTSHGNVSTARLEIRLRSVVLIQRWYRRYLARMELRSRYTWTIFQSIEYAGELDQMKLYNFFNALLTHLEDAQQDALISKEKQQEKDIDIFAYDAGDSRISHLGKMVAPERDDLMTLTDPERVRVETAYKGPRLNFPMAQADLNRLIDGLKNKKLLHVHYAYKLLHEAVRVLRTLPSVNRPSSAVAGRITVCGDLHGKLDDLLVIFHKNGLPSSSNPYVFNGDFVDRGRHSVEVLFILLACLVVSPNGVYLNRGNHEDPLVNLRYGFTREVVSKYKSYSSRLLALIEEVFSWLPLGSIIDRKVLVVHGGISVDTDLAWLETIDRHQFSSILRMPSRVENNLPTQELLRNKLCWKQIVDLLWSDPQPMSGCEPNVFRGGGCYFGYDVTDKVLRINGLQMLIRSHECKSDGYEYTHNGKCLTVFSASNYYGPGSNRGAYVILQGKELKPHFVQFTAQTKTKYISIRQRVGALEATALNELRKKIMECRPVLMAEFQKRDPTNSGTISCWEWVSVMEKHCCSTIPWRVFRERLLPGEQHSKRVQYADTFIGGCTDHGKKNQPNVVELLYKHRERLETIFRILDKDHSGFLSLDEFADACSLLQKYLQEPIPYDEMVNMARSMDINKDGFIDFNEFLETFRLVDMNPISIEDQ